MAGENGTVGMVRRRFQPGVAQVERQQQPLGAKMELSALHLGKEPLPCAPRATPSPSPAMMRLTSRGGEGDFAGGPLRHLTLAAAGRLPALCCKIPGVLLFSLIFTVVASAVLAPKVFYWITAALTIYTLTYSANLSVSGILGAWRMRRASSEDWDSRLRQFQAENPQGSEVLHLVILPNYKEEEEMLWHTLENIGRSPLAKACIRVMLAMEEREAGSRQKAERLMARAGHLFADMSAAFHPAGLPGEIAGKSSNTQWGYREALRRYGSELNLLDTSRVFVTVGDADTLWNPQYFSALSLEGLQLSEDERAWSFWQPPILLMRNLFSVPGPIRVSAYGTILFELAGIANQRLSSHFCFSAYSTTLAMLSHPLINGWDKDVIAEDHHMFCKCYFASLWQMVDSPQRAAEATMESKVQLRPIYLPAISYNVEADGWLDSCGARFTQARRHSQGVAELSYVLLQYFHLLLAAGAKLPYRTHTQILSIASKMANVHIINMLHAFAVLMTGAFLGLEVLRWALAGGLAEMLGEIMATGLLATFRTQSFGSAGVAALCAIFGPMPPIGILMTVTCYIVIHDLVEGRLTQSFSDTKPTKEAKDSSRVCLQPVAPDVQGSVLAAPGARVAALGFRKSLSLFMTIVVDFANWAELTLVGYGLIPVMLASWSLMFHGTKFEYIVAAKPS